MKTIVLTLAAVGAATTAVALPQIAIPAGLLAAPTAQMPAGPLQLAATARLVDGTYTGPAIDAYYGLLQVQAIVQNGKIVSLKMLRYPSDRRESLFISQQALPRLRDEVVRVQSAKVDIISGATLTSQAFIRSLDAALTQAQATAL